MKAEEQGRVRRWVGGSGAATVGFGNPQRCGMDPNRFTEKMQEALRSAQSRAIRQSHQQVDVEHLMAALLEQEGGLAGGILAKAGLSTPLLGAKLEQEIERAPQVTGPTRAAPGHTPVTRRLNR